MLDVVSKSLLNGKVCEWCCVVDGILGDCMELEDYFVKFRKVVLDIVDGKCMLLVLMLLFIYLFVVGGGYDVIFMIKFVSL